MVRLPGRAGVKWLGWVDSRASEVGASGDALSLQRNNIHPARRAGGPGRVIVRASVAGVNDHVVCLVDPGSRQTLIGERCAPSPL